MIVRSSSEWALLTSLPPPIASQALSCKVRISYS